MNVKNGKMKHVHILIIIILILFSTFLKASGCGERYFFKAEDDVIMVKSLRRLEATKSTNPDFKWQLNLSDKFFNGFIAKMNRHNSEVLKNIRNRDPDITVSFRAEEVAGSIWKIDNVSKKAFILFYVNPEGEPLDIRLQKFENLMAKTKFLNSLKKAKLVKLETKLETSNE